MGVRVFVGETVHVDQVLGCAEDGEEEQKMHWNYWGWLGILWLIQEASDNHKGGDGGA